MRDQYPALGVKVGPGVLHDALPLDVEAQWVSVDGDVVEAAVWCGPLATRHGRGALVINGEGAHAIHDSGATVSAGPLRDYLLEPDGAVIRAGLVADAAKLVVEDALAVQAAGARMLLVEAVPPEVTKYIWETLDIPVLSIGAGPHCDGQLLIVSDLIGQFQAFTPKFVKKYCNRQLITR